MPATTSYRARFQRLIDELNGSPAIDVRQAVIGPPTDPQEIAKWQAVAGPAWPDGMTDLYRELSLVDIDYDIRGGSTGGIHIPTVSSVWSYDDLENELWFDWLKPDHPFHRIRPIDRFVPEAYAVLYPVPSDREAEVAFHYCGESLVPTGLSFRAWLELLFRSRGVAYWLDLTTGPAQGRTWVEDNIDLAATLFPDFKPATMTPPVAVPEIDIG